MRGICGRSEPLPYGLCGICGRSEPLPYGGYGICVRSEPLAYGLCGICGRSEPLPYGFGGFFRRGGLLFGLFALNVLFYVLLRSQVLPGLALLRLCGGRCSGGIHGDLTLLQRFSALDRGKGIGYRRLLLWNLQLGACGILLKCLSDRVIHAFKDRLFVGELDLQLCRMDVDVHARGVELDKQHAAREFFGRAIRGKRLLQRCAGGFALDIA